MTLVRGRQALAAGQVGVILVAGGQGTRLGFDHPKGMFRIGPVSGRTLFQIHVEKLLATVGRFGVRIPLYLMTSPATHDETVKYLNANDRFGLPVEDLHVFCQGTMPAVDAATGRVLLEAVDRLALSPNGHGGMLAAFATSGAMADAQRRGISQLFYFQVDNPLVEIAGPEYIGYHVLSDSEMTTQVIAKRDPLEKVGNVVSADGRSLVIEYSDLPDDIARLTNADGSLKIWAGSIAVHVFDLAFLRRMAGQLDSQSGEFPFHIANKKGCLHRPIGQARRAGEAQRDQVRAVHLRPDAGRAECNRRRGRSSQGLRAAEERLRHRGRHAGVGEGPDGRLASRMALGRRCGSGRCGRGNQPVVCAGCRGIARKGAGWNEVH